MTCVVRVLRAGTNKRAFVNKAHVRGTNALFIQFREAQVVDAVLE
jgi:hypothetical protein